MSFSDYGASDYDRTESRPDKALLVKCTCEGRTKKILFNSTRTCTYDLLRQRVEECFFPSATTFGITYTDDDGEVADISTDADLTEAIRYFYPASDDPPVSSSSSILSGRSLTRGKITLHVGIAVDYDGPSLSDTSSLVSLEEYRNRNGSTSSLSLSSSHAGEIDDDSVTVSSKDTGSKYDVFRARGPKTIISGPSREPLINRSDNDQETRSMSSIPSTLASDVLDGASQPLSSSAKDPFADGAHAMDSPLYPTDSSSVFLRLKLEEEMQGREPSSSYGSSTLHSERGAAWLRDQNARAMKAMLGDVPAPDDAVSNMSGLALQQDTRGKFYYAYTGGSSYAASQSAPDSGYDDGSVADPNGSTAATHDPASRPTSMEMNGFELVDEFTESHLHRSVSVASSSSMPFGRWSNSELTFSLDYVYSDVPAEVLPFIQSLPPQPPPNPMNCSECGVILDTIRYVCSTCGDKRLPSLPGSDYEGSNFGKGKDRAIAISYTNGHGHSYPPSPSSPSMSQWSLVTDAYAHPRSPSDSALVQKKPLPAIPRGPSEYRPTLAVPGARPVLGTLEIGYELCANCIESAGVTHALEMSVAPGSSPGPGLGSSAEDAQRALSQWRRSAPSQKGHLRHAYIEKSWGHRGWQDVEQDDHTNCTCSTCGTQIVNHHRYKCASCANFNLCRACYSQIHEIHPSHAFLVVPNQLARSKSEPALGIPSPPPTGELSLKHPDVKCAHCMQDIVGARFHCAICDSIDICSNCESAGLPGNLDSSDGGHNSSHIMIKIPYPLETAELQSASRRAKIRWTGRDAVTGEKVRSRRNSLTSSYDHTVLGTGSRAGDNSDMNGASIAGETNDHGVRCQECNQRILGTRYQCGSCPSKPIPYSLCSSCEERSYVLHNPMHIFFKLRRPVHRPLQSEYPFLPRLYKMPVGPVDGRFDSKNHKAYLKSVFHTAAVCDLCMMRIQGEWFRCAYCATDLCEVCEGMETHNDKHAFVVFKSPIDMNILKQYADVENPSQSPPLIPYPIYT
ncbi:hypothetical protein AcV7_003165 [Taiwanofungus camphoratus]|nr:hypothetical protein AcV7_003165 [Antrodia cinnamomea]